MNDSTKKLIAVLLCFTLMIPPIGIVAATTEVQPAAGDTSTSGQALEALSEGTYTYKMMLVDHTHFNIVNNTQTSSVKLNEKGYMEFALASETNVKITYKCGSSASAKSAGFTFDDTNAPMVSGSTASVFETTAAAGTHRITGVQKGGTTVQITEIVIGSGIAETTTEATTVTVDESTTETTTAVSTEQPYVQTTEGYLIPLEEGKYTDDMILLSHQYFIIAGNSGKDNDIKLKESQYMYFTVKDGAAVTISYRCGSSKTSKSAGFKLENNKAVYTSPVVKGNADAVDYTVKNLSGTCFINCVQTGDTTVQIKSITVSYSADTEPEYQAGDADGSGALTARDSAEILQKVLNSAYTTGVEQNTSNVSGCLDANGDGLITAADASAVLQKVLNSSFDMQKKQ